MQFIADVHLHSRFSRACSRDLDLEHLAYWAQLKGVTVVGAADFTHPEWFDELQQKLAEAEDGLFRLKGGIGPALEDQLPESCRAEVRFILSTEISSIYKKGDRTRKVHTVVFVPSLEAAARLAGELAKVGNIASDGRPILGLDCRQLLEMVMDADPDAFLVPAHIWTPHFSVLGAASGFDSIEECFEDLTPEIFAVETGLSSDPPMNWRLSALDRFTLISNSDAHSPPKLMREANVFDAELSYRGIHDAWRTGDPQKWKGTIEFFPEEGKYHLDGHRKCDLRLKPEETRAHDGRCPRCGKKITVGVLSRVVELSDRPEGFLPPGRSPFRSLVPLPEILGQVFQQGDKTKRVQNEYFRLLDHFGNEYGMLTRTPLEELAAFSSPLLATAIGRTRSGEVDAVAGYDGQFGVINALTEADRAENNPQMGLFAGGEELPPSSDAPEPGGKQAVEVLAARPEDLVAEVPLVADPAESDLVAERPQEYHHRSPLLDGLNHAQREAVEVPDGPLLLVAGAGTGKTNALTRRMAFAVKERGLQPERLLAVTFTQKAAAEIRERVSQLLDDASLTRRLQIGTIHSVSARLLRQLGQAVGVATDFHVADEPAQAAIAREALATAWDPPDLQPAELLNLISTLKHRGRDGASEPGAAGSRIALRNSPECSAEAFRRVHDLYEKGLARLGALDFDDLILKATELFGHPDAGPAVRGLFLSVLVDEAQDLNDSQYAWLQALAADHARLILVGDPDQSIYSFRGANVETFRRFIEDYPNAVALRLEENYRCPETVLAAAEQLISCDPDRLPKKLFTNRRGGRKVQIWECESTRVEASRVVGAIEEMVEETSMERRDAKGPELPLSGIARGFGDVAILTRTNAQHFAFAEALRKAGIPFQAAAAIRRKPSEGIRSLIALARLAASKDDDAALEFLLLEEVRGVGEKTLAALKGAAAEKGGPLYDTLCAEIRHSGCRPALRESVEALLERIEGLGSQFERDGIRTTLRQRFTGSGLLGDSAKDPDALFLLLLAARYGGSEGGVGSDAGQLQDFLTEAALRLDSDLLDPRTESVKLLTIHAAKGMEFPVVFVCGLEEGLLPVSEADESQDTLNEERRLLYVAMTRAREQLILTSCRSRFIYGSEAKSEPSRFVAELPVEDFDTETFLRRTSKRQQMENAQLRLF